jgi:hypothetical protein
VVCERNGKKATCGPMCVGAKMEERERSDRSLQQKHAHECSIGFAS